MKPKAPPRRKAPAVRRPRSIALDAEHRLVVTAADDGHRLRVTAGGADRLVIDIVMGPDGPTLRVRAAAITLEADGDIAARCRSFSVEAREAVAIEAGGALTVRGASVSVEAVSGAARVRANDDVQLLGEQVLLNCDRQPPMPSWVQTVAAPALLPAAAASGDEALVDALRTRGR